MHTERSWRAWPLALLLLAGPASRAEEPERKQLPAVGIEEKLGAFVPLDLTFTDEAGQPVVLRDLVNKPTILTLVYYKCPGICSPLLTELSKIVDKMDLVPGKDYEIVTLSFNHREDHELAADKKDNYLGSMAKHVDPAGWRFLTGDSVSIRRLADAVGFEFAPYGKDFVHSGTLIVLSPEGKVTRYLAGIKYLPLDVKLALMEAADGRVGPTIAKLVSMCYSYDPEGRTYVFNIMRVVGVGMLALVALFVIVFVRKPRTQNKEQ